MDGTGEQHFEQNKPSSKSPTSHFQSYVESRFKMVMIIVIIIMKMKYECKEGTTGRQNQSGGGE
jgi:hypothetical protein